MTLALTHSSWINAWTLQRACAELGVGLRVPPGAREMPLPMLREGEVPQWLFFTEEASLRQALQQRDAAASGARFLPERFPLELLDDKWAFAEYLAQDAAGPRGLRQWSWTEADCASYPMLLKARHSWFEGRKLPRGWLCADADALALRRAHLVAQGLAEEWYFLQEWLGERGAHEVLSVAGFFDAAAPQRNLALLTRRVRDYGGNDGDHGNHGDGGPSSSAMLVTEDDERGLVAATERVLARLAYRGPYEMEYIATRDRCLLLELNPRFWMQHGLFLARGNALVRRYLGLDAAPATAAAPVAAAAEPAAAASPPLVWIDGVWLARQLARGRFGLLNELWTWRVHRGHRLVICPNLPALVKMALWRAFGGARR